MMARSSEILSVSTVELYEKRVLTEEAVPSSQGNNRRISIVDAEERVSGVIMEESSNSQRCNKDWLISIMMNGAEKGTTQSPFKPRIQKASRRLREVEVYRKCFDPALASIGPFHHGKLELQAMEKLKSASARQFVSICDRSIDIVYSKVLEVVAQARECYSDGSTSEFDDEAFTRIMFLDGCFVLHFIYCIANDKQSELTNCCYTTAFLLRDLFLLENQLPYVVLQALMSLRFTGDEGESMVIKFINQRISPPGCCSMGMLTTDKDPQPQPQVQPLHLLDLLRTRLVGVSSVSGPLRTNDDTDWHSFRSVKELKAVGINFKRSHTNSLRDINFKSYKIYGELSLPPIAIDDSTMSRFLNLIAYEMCPDACLDYEVTSYICFLDALIDHAEDVKELRSKGILLNFLGSDDQVADLFNQLTTELVPDPNIYYKVKSGIESHYKNSIKVSMVEFLTNHFGSPWTAFGFFAATLVILLTCVQTIFTVYSPK